MTNIWLAIRYWALATVRPRQAIQALKVNPGKVAIAFLHVDSRNAARATGRLLAWIGGDAASDGDPADLADRAAGPWAARDARDRLAPGFPIGLVSVAAFFVMFFSFNR